MRMTISTRYGLIISAALLIMGCAHQYPPESLSSPDPATGPFFQTYDPAPEPLPPLDENSSLEDFLTYAELNNPGLKAEFLKWKAALEKIPEVKALPDPRFTYAGFIEHVETRVGPQRQRFGLSQAFPWFGKLDLKAGSAMELARLEVMKTASRATVTAARKKLSLWRLTNGQIDDIVKRRPLTT